MFSTVAFPDVSADRTHPFACTLETGDVGPAVVRVAGELDLSTASWLEQALRRAESRAQLVVLDLRQLTFMDSCGAHLIVDASTRARRAKCRLMLVRGPAQVDRLFSLCGASDVLEIVDLDPAEAFTGALAQLQLAGTDVAA
jgi:anti-sigma B factor antagonist